MLWIRDTRFSDQIQPLCLQTGGGYFFCFTASSASRNRDELLRLGFRRTNEGLVAPLDYRLAGKLRNLPDFEDIKCDWAEIAVTPETFQPRTVQGSPSGEGAAEPVLPGQKERIDEKDGAESPGLSVLGDAADADDGRFARTGDEHVQGGNADELSGSPDSAVGESASGPAQPGGGRAGVAVYGVRPGRPRNMGTAPSHGRGAGHDLELGGKPAGEQKRNNRSVENTGANMPATPLNGVVREDNPQDEAQPEPVHNGRNFHIPDDFEPVRGQVSRAKANIIALNLLRKIQTERREATPDEKRQMALFSGWGSLSEEVFNWEYCHIAEQLVEGRRLEDLMRDDEIPAFERWRRKYGEPLSPIWGTGLMSPEEWRGARQSTVNAFFTSPELARAMWRIAERLGFSGGRVLEPSAGSGVFLGTMPEHLARKSKISCVELEPLTGQLLQALYPDADVQIAGFEGAKRIDDNAFDLIISNFPFGDYAVFDPRYKSCSNQSIHNYFFSRSLEALSPGGLIIALTSHYTMDASTAASIRKNWEKKADLVGAVRLPKTAHRESGTEVVSDIIILKKKGGPELKNYNYELFRHSMPIAIDGEAGSSNEYGISINEYFIQHPEMILGKNSASGSMYGGYEYTVLPNERELGVELSEAISRLPEREAVKRGVIVEDNENMSDESMPYEGEARDGALVEYKGVVGFVEEGRLRKPSWSDRQMEQARAYIRIKEALHNVINIMHTEQDDAPVVSARKILNEAYDSYVGKYGNVTPDIQNRKLNKNRFLHEDSEFYNVAALENVKRNERGEEEGLTEREIVKAEIFSRRTIFPYSEPKTAEDINDALKISLSYRNNIDIDYISDLLSISTEKSKALLIERGLAFVNPETEKLEEKESYLSGNIKEKINTAKERLPEHPEYQINIDALTEVLPKPRVIDEISVKLGTSWLPPDIIEEFLTAHGVNYPKVRYMRIDSEQEGVTSWSIDHVSLTAEARDRWSVEGADFVQLVDAALNLKRFRVMVPTQTGEGVKYVEDKQLSLAAQEKQKEIQAEFIKFVRENEEFSVQVENIYNDKYNSHVIRKFSVPEYEHFPGASNFFTLRPHQKLAVARALRESTLLAHEVGTGKTLELITAAREMRRLGIARKPWIVVQGATIQQFAASFAQLYPDAKILCPTEAQRKASNRKKLLAQIATGDWDAVITPHSFFNSISVSPQIEKKFLADTIDEYEQALENEPKSRRNITVKYIEKKLNRFRARYQELLNIKKDTNIYFDELGVDALLIDEAHAYKRGSFITKMDNVKGLDRDSSQRSMQLLMKARIIQEKTGGKNIILATGTPISNTLTEFWTLFRYIRPDLLQQFNVAQFDDFASTFADTTIGLEETATGDYNLVERFNKYVNGRDLLTLWKMGADVALADDMPYLSRPELEGGKIRDVTIERSHELADYIKTLKAARDSWEKSPRRKEFPSVPLEIYGLAKRAAIDLRLVSSDFPDLPDSKTNTVVRNTFERWKQYSDSRAAQAIFSGYYQSSDGSFNLFKDIKRKLVSLGVPEKEIAIIHDYNTDQARLTLFEKVNSGEVRIIMGTTERLGTGVNIQERLKTLHHFDAPQLPKDFEQRNGRILRQGNMFKQVEILAYGTRNTLDSVLYQQLINKQKFINQVLRGDMESNTFENPFDSVQSTFEDMLAAFSGNPLVAEKNRLSVELRRLTTLHDAHLSRMGNIRKTIREEEALISSIQKKLPDDLRTANLVREGFEERFVRKCIDILKGARQESVKDIRHNLEGLGTLYDFENQRKHDKNKFTKRHRIETANGLHVDMELSGILCFENDVMKKKISGYMSISDKYGIIEKNRISGSDNVESIMNSLVENAAGKYEKNTKEIERLQKSIESRKNELNRPFSHQKELEESSARMNEVEEKLKNSINEDLKIEHEVNFMDVLHKNKSIENEDVSTEYVSPEM